MWGEERVWYDGAGPRGCRDHSLFFSIRSVKLSTLVSRVNHHLVKRTSMHLISYKPAPVKLVGKGHCSGALTFTSYKI